MLRKFINKRVAVVLGGGILAVIGAMAAFAFMTGSGSGSGAATVASDSAVTITGVTYGGQLYPGHGTPVTFTVQNQSPSVPLSVSSVIADTTKGTNGISGLTTATNGASPATCDATNFTFAPVTGSPELPASTGTNVSSVVETGTLAMTDASTNQDACKGQAPTLNLTVKNP